MNTPTLHDGFQRRVDAALRRVNTSIPAKVLSYDRARQSIEAQPLVRVAYTDESGVRRVERLPAVTNVPIAFQGAGAYSSTFPLAKGDTVLLLFSQASLDKWCTRGGDVDPIDDRRFDLSDAIALPGLRAFPDALGDDATADDAWVMAGPEIRIGGASGTEPTLMAEAFKSAISTMIAAIASAVGGISGSGPQTAAGAAITTAKNTFLTAMDGAMTTIAKVK